MKCAAALLAVSIAVSRAQAQSLSPFVASELQSVTTNLSIDFQSQTLLTQLKATAAQQMTQPLVPYGLVGPDMLPSVRIVLYRVHLYSLLYQVTGDTSYASQARAEMLNAASWPDWNPSHLIDTAEMCRAEVSGLKWLGSYLSAADQLTIRQALDTNGLHGFLANQTLNGGWGWMNSSNWNAVVTTGICMAANESISIDPTTAKSTLGWMSPSILQWIKDIPADGSYIEGANYLGYALNYLSAYMEYFQGTWCAITPQSLPPSITNALEFRKNLELPAGLFNYGDCTEAEEATPYLSYLGSRLGLPDISAFQYSRITGDWVTPISNASQDAVDSMWLPTQTVGVTMTSAAYAAVATYPSLGLGILRSNSNQTGLALGAKGGKNSGYHCHQDLGTFVLDALGQRWGVSLGPDSYSLPNYFSQPQNHAYYRVNTHGQNTLCFSGVTQDSSGTGTLSTSWNRTDSQGFVLDLGLASQAHESSWKRAFVMVPSGYALIQDEFTCPVANTPVLWSMHTHAAITFDASGTVATLSQGGSTVNFQILSPAGATWRTESAYQAPPQNPNTGVTTLECAVQGSTNLTTLSIAVIPQGTNLQPTPTLQSIAAWSAAVSP
jgi:hypothetical protein